MSYRGSLTKAEKIVVLHADTKEKIETDFVGGLREFLTIVDKKSMFLKAVPLRSKADTSV